MPFYRDHVYLHLVNVLGDPEPTQRFAWTFLATHPSDGPLCRYAVSTFTLCTLPGVVEVIRGIGHVLVQGGKFIFFEHGLAPEPRVQALAAVELTLDLDSAGRVSSAGSPLTILRPVLADSGQMTGNPSVIR